MEWLVLAEHVHGRHPSLEVGVLPIPHLDALVQYQVMIFRHVAGGPNIRHAGGQVFVGQDAAVTIHAGAGQLAVCLCEALPQCRQWLQVKR